MSHTARSTIKCLSVCDVMLANEILGEQETERGHESERKITKSKAFAEPVVAIERVGDRPLEIKTERESFRCFDFVMSLSLLV